MARQGMQQAKAWAQGLQTIGGPGLDCVKLYEEAESRLARLVPGERDIEWSHDDAVTWFSAALTSHITCMDALAEIGLPVEAQRAHNLTSLIREALAVYRAPRGKRKGNSLVILISFHILLLLIYKNESITFQ